MIKKPLKLKLFKFAKSRNVSDNMVQGCHYSSIPSYMRDKFVKKVFSKEDTINKVRTIRKKYGRLIFSVGLLIFSRSKDTKKK